jgi:molybdenum cofactor guanylyltransferase
MLSNQRFDTANTSCLHVLIFEVEKNRSCKKHSFCGIKIKDVDRFFEPQKPVVFAGFNFLFNILFYLTSTEAQFMKSIIILCGGRSRRMGEDKGSLVLNGKPMIIHVLDAIKDIADEIVLVLRDHDQIDNYKSFLKDENVPIKIVTDEIKDQGPLVGILTGLSQIDSEYAQILPCDSPFISKEFVLKMFEIAEGKKFDAIVPIWDDGHIEPLHSIYKRDIISIIRDLIKKEKHDVKSLIENLDVEYADVEDLDETTMNFQNINTINDLKAYNH